MVTHSQGGLILQRYLAWMLGEGRGRELTTIRLIVTLSCPNEGSEYLSSIRAVAAWVAILRQVNWMCSGATVSGFRVSLLS